MSDTFTQQIKDAFVSPKHMGYLQNASGIGEVGNIFCGDTVKMFVKMSNDSIEDVKFQTAGCMYSVACADTVADLAKGKNADDAKSIAPADVTKQLGGVPNDKEHCAEMAVNAFRIALQKAGSQVELLKNAKELTDDVKNMIKTPLDIQLKHRIAELFDEFLIPELKSRGVKLALDRVDIDSHAVTVSMDKHSAAELRMIEGILRKHILNDIKIMEKEE